jgi:acetyl-CoA synthetase
VAPSPLPSTGVYPIIHKERDPRGLAPNLRDYDDARARFSWERAGAAISGLPNRQGLNIAYEAVDRHVEHGRGHRDAFRFIARNGARRMLTYDGLRLDTNRFANALARLGVGRSDRVFALAGRIPELYIAALGSLKAGAVFCPLFSAFGPDPVMQRASRGEARVLVTTIRLFEKKVEPVLPHLPRLEHVLLADADTHQGPGRWSLPKLMAEASDRVEVAATGPEDMALLHFTSGTTGLPKGAVHVHAAVYMHHLSAHYALDLHPEDIFWCTADPGWVTGTSYGIVAPLVIGATSVVDEGEFDARRWFQALADEGVTVWYTAPTALRRLMRVEGSQTAGVDLSRLRFIASVGEPLNPEVVAWGAQSLGRPIHDNWWQTETGGIMIANYATMDIRPGSMGRPLPGVTAGIVRREGGRLVEVAEPDVTGELALRPGWPSMFRGYLHDETRYRKCFEDGWYLSGDLARRDADGYYWFVGRGDDIIKTAGHMVGPFEVESAMMEHPAVAEVAVIGKPDPLMGELVKAFVALKPGVEPTDALRQELLGYGRERLGAAAAPKEIAFDPYLPRTRSGKIMRRLLKARELGRPEGDTSTLETDA